ncbi:ABC transporter substrate-binding protein [Falsiroseomonas selenitidurans]|uniref:ABC transporter substrate-binding protein n=1 Tax=Falsiroseomonas selenitidurans TaxID=2716335 RepID=A0ABX1E6R2_9PROT|nr:ABC transporter substrate-binding protein [Falsiroseomonas selenitidurans]NKC32473.1 ABC transporter substrate-binding protein [Falsiroseomonas selenitidurans]
MTNISRRALFAAPTLLAMPAIAQGDDRPTLTIAVQKLSNSNTFEPPREQSNVGFRIHGLYAEQLVGTNWLGNADLVPGLATAWRRRDASTLELTLRPGVRFHDGREMTAEDVAFSFGARLFGTQGSSGAGQSTVLAGTATKEPPAEVIAVSRRTYPGLARIEIVDRHTVRFVNRSPDVTLEGRIAQSVGAILSREAFAAAPSWLEWGRAPVGTGPYRIAEFRPDTALVMEAHDAYWGGRPPARRLRFVEVPEVSGRVNGLFSGEYDFACDIPPDQISVVERNSRFEVLGSPINNIRKLAFDKSNPVLADARIRRAMSHAIDRQVLVDTLWAGRTVIPRGMQLESYGAMYLPDWENPRFDLAEARRLLREANYQGQPITYRLLNNYYTNQVASGQIAVEMWRAAGLNVQIEMMENFAQVTARTPGRGVRDWSNTSIFGDPVAGILRSFGPRTEAERTGEWSSATFNETSAALETETDLTRRRELFRRLLTILEREDPGYIVLHQAAAFTAKRKDIQWRAAKGWAMVFSQGNLRVRA